MNISKRTTFKFKNSLFYHSKECPEAWSSKASFTLIELILVKVSNTSYTRAIKKNLDNGSGSIY